MVIMDMGEEEKPGVAAGEDLPDIPDVERAHGIKSGLEEHRCVAIQKVTRRPCESGYMEVSFNVACCSEDHSFLLAIEAN